jgi:hypothetical protein
MVSEIKGVRGSQNDILFKSDFYSVFPLKNSFLEGSYRFVVALAFQRYERTKRDKQPNFLIFILSPI